MKTFASLLASLLFFGNRQPSPTGRLPGRRVVSAFRAAEPHALQHEATPDMATRPLISPPPVLRNVPWLLAIPLALAVAPAAANGCGSETADFVEAGGLLVKVRNEAGREIGEKIEYFVQIAVASPKHRKINPHSFTVRIEGPNGWGQTAFAYYDGVEGEDYFRDWHITCSSKAPTMRIVGLRKGFVERAVLLVDGQRTLTWNIADKIEKAPTPAGPSSPPPASPPTQPPPVEPPPVASPPPPPVTPPPPPTAPVPGTFKPLRRVDVRVDRVVVARGYPTHQVHAFVTVRNTSPTLQYFTSGFLKALLTDADGVSLERSQPYRASGEPAELFGATPVIQPGGELKVRYVFTPPQDARLTSLTLSEGATRAEFPVSGL